MRNSLKITVISSPNFKNQEAVMITRLMEAGLEKFHLRKPEASANEIASLLEEIPSVHHPKIMIHRKIELLEDYKLGGTTIGRMKNLKKSVLLAVVRYTNLENWKLKLIYWIMFFGPGFFIGFQGGV